MLTYASTAKVNVELKQKEKSTLPVRRMIVLGQKLQVKEIVITKKTSFQQFPEFLFLVVWSSCF
jgi:hypothetical protein